MHIVRAATPAKVIHLRMGRPEINILARQFIRIVRFEMAQLAQGTIAQRSRVGTYFTDAICPRFGRKCRAEIDGMRTFDHV